MYGQTTGTAGNGAAADGRTYPRRWRYLRNAEESGRAGRAVADVRRPAGRSAARCEPADAARDGFARNAVVQGAAAELFKAWAVTVRRRAGRRARQIVLCLHDELLVHAPRDARGRGWRSCWPTPWRRRPGWWAAGSGVRFVADVSTADSWADAH